MAHIVVTIVVGLLVTTPALAPSADRSDPERARFVTEDVDRFWRAYDLAAAAPPAERAAIFQREYIDRGTVGLKDFGRTGRVGAKSLAALMQSHAAFLAAIRPTTTAIGAQRAETLAAFRKLKALYPEATFPDIYFVIGHLSSGGTASENGLLMGVEMFTRTPGLPMGELTDWQRGALMEPGEIPALVAHESIHFQQEFGDSQTLLAACLREGSADFLGELTSGRLVARMQATHAWANARERELWEEFRKEMNSQDTTRWLYGKSGGPDRPVDLGYWMGYKIAEAHYRNAADKRRAVREILHVADPAAFLAASRYAEKFEPHEQNAHGTASGSDRVAPKR